MLTNVNKRLYHQFAFTLFSHTMLIQFVWSLMPYQQYFSYLTATVHESMFSGLFLTSTLTSSLS